MFELKPIVSAGLTGFLSGFLFSIPVGPINITIINEGARRGFKCAFLIAVGALVMDFIYCAAAFAGFSGLFTSRWAAAVFELLSFLATLYLGWKYLRVQDLPATTKGVEVVEHKLHPHTAFMIGFVRVLGNPAVFLFWITLSATYISHEWIENTWRSKVACVAGTTTGVFTWFILLSFLVSLGHGKFSTKTLVKMSHISGAALLGVSLIIGIRLVSVLAQLKRARFE
ncbi:MAG: LysE family transporter [Verrucomicrobiota bacterium]